MKKKDLSPYQLKKVKRGICCYSGCSKQIYRKGRYVCHSHKHKEYKQRHPIRYAYQSLRSNAKRRGKEFTISFEYFRKFCIKTKILLGRGRKADSYHIDRIDEEKGYVEGNLQVLTNTENIKKYREYDWFTKQGNTVTRNQNYKSSAPF